MANPPELDEQPASEAINPVANAIKATIIAIVVVTASIAAFLHFSRPAPMFSGNVIRISAAPMPIQRQTDEGTDLPVTIADQLLVFGQIHIQNLSNKTLTIQEINADILENGTTVVDPKNPNLSTTTTRRSVAASGRDFKRVFDTFPQFASFHTDPILSDTKIAPHQALDGSVIFSYPISQKQWDLRRGVTVHVEFDNNSTLTMQAP